MIAGIKEGLYDAEPLATYLLYRLNVLDPVGTCFLPTPLFPSFASPPMRTSLSKTNIAERPACSGIVARSLTPMRMCFFFIFVAPAYLEILPPGTSPTTDVEEFLDTLGKRLGMLGRGGIVDHNRAAVWFLHWWRNQGALASAKSPLPTRSSPSFGLATDVAERRHGWGFDLEWTVSPEEAERYNPAAVQRKMEECLDNFEAEAAQEEQEGGGVSSTQLKKKARDEELAKRAKRTQARLGARKS